MVSALQNTMMPALERSQAMPAGEHARPGTRPPYRWGLPTSIALHSLVLLALGVLVLHPRAAPAPAPAPAFDLIFSPPPPLVAMLAAATLAGPQPQLVFDTLPQTLPRISSAPLVQPTRQHRPAPVPARRSTAPSMEPGFDPGRPGMTSGASGASVPAAAPGKQPPEGTPGAVPGDLSGDLLAVLQAKIRQAVQEAMAYPDSARMLHREGRAQVGFAFAHGAVSHITLFVSSGSRSLDGAALEAVQQAKMPPEPAALGDRTLPLQVWVRFSLASSG